MDGPITVQKIEEEYAYHGRLFVDRAFTMFDQTYDQDTTDVQIALQLHKAITHLETLSPAPDSDIFAMKCYIKYFYRMHLPHDLVATYDKPIDFAGEPVKIEEWSHI